MNKNAIIIHDLGVSNYSDCYKLQKELVGDVRCNPGRAHIIFTEHNPVFTIGRTGAEDNLLCGKESLAGLGIDFIRTDRGGDITYHAPGQLVIYPIIDLKACGLDLHMYLRILEEAAIGALSVIGITATRKPCLTGAWVDGAKIASIAVAASSWVAYHGVSINVNNDLAPFSMINPCGLSGVRMTSAREILGYSIPTDKLKHGFIDSIVKQAASSAPPQSISLRENAAKMCYNFTTGG